MRITTNGGSAGFHELEIVARRKHLFWVCWLLLTGFIFGFSYKALPTFSLSALPFWSLWLLGAAIFQLKGWIELLWSFRGKEIVRIFTDRIEYVASGGSFLNHRSVTLPLESDRPAAAEILTLGIGSNASQNRIRLRVAGRDLYFGRNLSKDQAILVT